MRIPLWRIYITLKLKASDRTYEESRPISIITPTHKLADFAYDTLSKIYRSKIGRKYLCSIGREWVNHEIKVKEVSK